MIARLNRILHQFRDAGTSALEPEAIVHACRQVGYTAWRDRLLNPVVTIQVFLLQVLHGNTACAHLPHLAGLGFTASAFCKARSKLPLGLFEAILRSSVRSLRATVDAAERWHGHRTFFVDGSGASMPDTPALQEAFGHPTGQRPGCGFPVAHLLGRFHAATGLLLQLLVDPLRTHDIATVPKVHPQLEPGDLLVADRGFCSYGHLALLLRDGLHGLLRVSGRMIVDFTPHRPHVLPGSRRSKFQGKGLPRSRWLRKLGAEDQLVEWLKPASAPPWMDPKVFAALPEALVVRELRYRVERPGFRVDEVTLVTTLLDVETYPKDDMSKLYLQRWEVETCLGYLKTAMKMDVLHCRTVEGVLKELMIFALAYNLIRLAMLESARRHGVEVQRISFVDAMRWLISPTEGKGLEDLVVNPSRPGRREPRVKKRRPKRFPFMTKSRRELRKDLSQEELAD
jgi:hypothetical protein